MKTNKNSATEDEIGKLHKIVTKGYSKLITKMIDAYDKAVAEGDTDGAQFIMDSRDLNAAAKWVSMNEMGSLPADQDETSDLKKKLNSIKSKHRNNVIDFTQEAVNE